MAPEEKEQTTSNRIKHGLRVFFLSLLGVFYRVGLAVAHFFIWLFHKSRVALVVFIVVVVLIFGGIIDYGVHAGKIYSGVSIGSVDVSDMTRDEAIDAVSAKYVTNLEDSNIIIFANEEVASTADVNRQIVQYEALAEQMSFEEAQESKILWLESGQSLSAEIPVEDLVDEALSVGRGDDGIGGRFSALTGGHPIDVNVTFDPDSIETLAADIDASVGTPRHDFSVKVDNGVASVVEGNDGYEVDRDWFKSKLSEAIITSDNTAGDSPGTFVAEVVYAPLRIDAQGAQQACDAINTLISTGATFTYGDTSLDVSREAVGDWVTTKLSTTDDGDYVLLPYLDLDVATPALVGLVNKDTLGREHSLSIEVDGDDATVIPHETIDVPLASDALSAFDEELFGEYRNGSRDVEAKDHTFSVETGQVSDPLSFDEAFNYGIITTVSTFTTDFVNTTSTVNRAHNIRLAADLLNNSVAAANGGRWSFNNIAGSCDEEAGFLDAGAIAGGEYIEEAGGGICQVATTVFNAVFEAGYAVIERSNHSLYVSSYPAGRDAAIAYPDLDLIWQNDTSSDVLLRTSYTDTSITVTLYGVDPNYIVTSETGNWVEGAKYSTITEVDDTLEPGTSYIKTAGTDGMEITVNRTVRDQNDTVLYEDVFNSTYSPVDEVIVQGP